MPAKRLVLWAALLFTTVLIVYLANPREAAEPAATVRQANLFLDPLLRSKARSTENDRRTRVTMDPAFEGKFSIRNETVMSGLEGTFRVLERRAMVADWVLAKLKRNRALTSGEREALRREGLDVPLIAGGSASGLFQVYLADPSRADAVDEALHQLQRLLPDLAFAEPDYVIQSAAFPENSPRLRGGGFWSLHNPADGEIDVDAPEAWDVQQDAGEVVIAVIDSGIDLDHPDLVANLWTQAQEVAGNGVDDDGNGFVDDVHGVNFVQAGAPPDDDSGHGTHCAGIIGADGHASSVDTTGIAWRCQLMALKVLDQRGVGTVSRAVAAIDYAIEQGASIANLSWNASAPSTALDEALERAREVGMICVAAAGNENRNLDQAPLFPAAAFQDHVISVAALARSGSLAAFSNFGRDSVLVAAPGQGILSTAPGGGTSLRSGSSMAAAHVAGALALLKARFPNEDYRQNIHRLLRGTLRSEGLRLAVRDGRRLNLHRSLATNTNRPPFDDFAEAFDPGSLRWFRAGLDLTHATGELGESPHGEGEELRSIWIRWTAPANDSVELQWSPASRAGVAVYQGDSLSELASVASSDGATGSLSFAPVSGETYHLAVNGTGEAGSVILTCFQKATNDALADAALLEGESWALASHNRAATKEVGEPPHAGNGGGASLWWRWTAPRDGWYRLSAAGSEIDTLLAVYPDAPEPIATFAGPNQHVVFVIDLSSSSRRPLEGSFVGDVNGDSLISTVLDAEIAAARVLLRLLEEQGPESTASVVVFDSAAKSIDLDPAVEGLQEAVNLTSHFEAVDLALRNLRSLSSGSNHEAALAFARRLLEENLADPSRGEVLLISDGIHTRGGSYADEGAAVVEAGYRLRAFGPGWTTDLAALSAATPEAVIFQTPEELLSLGWNALAASDNSASDATSEVIFFAEAGQPYAIALDGYEGAQGRVLLSGSYGSSLEVISEARDVTVRRGERVIFDVGVESDFPTYYQWYRNGSPLLSEAGKRRLTIDHADLDDAGEYVLVVANGVQSVTSETMTLSLETGPPQIVAAPTELQTVIGETLTLSLGIDDYGFPVDIQWFFEGEELVGEKGRRLQLADADASRSGTYHAVLTNDFGTTQTEPMVVRIADGPLEWVRAGAPIGDFSGGGVLNNTYLIGSVAGNIFLSADGASWKQADVETPPLRQDGLTQLLAVSSFHRLDGRYYAFVWSSSLIAREGMEGGWFSDDLETWHWDPQLPFLKDVIAFDGGYLGLQPETTSSRLYHSVDGSQWRRLDLPGTMNTSATPPAFGNGTFLSVDQGTSYLSEDGVTWTAMASNLDRPVERNAFFFAEGRFHAFNLSDGVRYSSDDGLEWEESALSGDLTRDSNATFLLRATSGYVMMARDRAHFSTDLDHWNRIEGTSHTYPLAGGVARGDEFLLYGYKGRLVFGNDVTMARSLDAAETLFGIREVGGKLFGSTLNLVKESVDGVNWIPTEHPFQFPPLSFGSGVFVRGTFNPLVFEYSHDGNSWQASPFREFNGVEFKDITYGNGAFVAVFEDGGIARSENGRDWTVIRALNPDPTSWDWRTVKYAGDAFFALSFDFNADPREVIVERSVDGVTWTRLDMPGAWEPYDIAHTGGRYVITGQGGQIRTSTDGITWELIDLPAQAEAATFSNLAAGRGYFVALSNHMVIMSRDGIDWYTRDFQNLRNVIYYNGNFFLMGEKGLIYKTPFSQEPTPQLVVSAESSTGDAFLFNQEFTIKTEVSNAAAVDHIDYFFNGAFAFRRTSPIENLPWLPRSTGPLTILARAETTTGASGTAATTIEVTFSDWQKMPSVAQPVAGMKTAFVVNDRYYGFGGDAVRLSENGVHWERYDLPENLVDPNHPLGHDVPVDITHLAGNEDGLLVALLDNGKIGYSLDGIEWAESGKLPSANAEAERFRIAGVAYGNGLFIVTALDDEGAHEVEAFSSPDGVTWSKVATLPVHLGYTVFFAGGFVLVGADAEFNTVSYRSQDGVEWVAGENLGRIGGSTGRGLVQGGGLLVLQTVDEEIQTRISDDGVTWTKLEYGEGEGPDFILGHDGDHFVAYEFARRVYLRSDDLQNWEVIPGAMGDENTHSDLRTEILHGPTGWLSVDGAFTSDLVTWVNDGPQPTMATAAVNGVAWSEDRLVAAGAGGGVAVTADGITWTYKQLDGDNVDALAYGNGVFVAMTGRESYISSDGIEWQEHVNQPSSQGELTFLNGLFIFATGGVATSPNGYEWTASREGLNLRPPVRFAYGEGVWAGVDRDAKIVASEDGTTWREVGRVASNLGGTFYMVHDEGRFHAGISPLYPCAESEDGLTWVAAESCFEYPPSFNTGNGARWSHHRERPVDDPGRVYLSVDGADWAPAFRPTNHLAPFRGEIYAIDSFYEIHKFTLADLRIASVEHDAFLREGDFLSATFEVQNAGLADLQFPEPVAVEARLSTNREWGDADDIVLGQTTMTLDVERNESTTGRGEWLIPHGLAPQSRLYLLLEIDATGIVPEINESNNVIITKQVLEMGSHALAIAPFANGRLLLTDSFENQQEFLSAPEDELTIAAAAAVDLRAVAAAGYRLTGWIGGPFAGRDPLTVTMDIDRRLAPIFEPEPVLSFDDWRRQTFTAAQLDNPSVSGRMADPDEDGLSNQVEFGLGTDGLTADAELPVEIHRSAGGILVRFHKALAARATVRLERSRDLRNWENAQVVIRGAVFGDKRIRYEVELAREPAEGVTFLRLAVEEETLEIP